VSQPPPGWYRHHADPRYERWWDGQQWTEQTRMPPDEVSRPIQVGRSIPKEGRNIVAATGFGLGLASIFTWQLAEFGLIVSLAAVIVSVVGLIKMKRVMPTKYWVYGIFGLLVGVLTGMMAILYMSGIYP
jgi:hypothetical protein